MSPRPPTLQELAAQIDDAVRWIQRQRGANGGWLHPKLNRPDRIADEVELRLSHVKQALLAHQCGLPASIVQALNEGDGVYRP